MQNFRRLLFSAIVTFLLVLVSTAVFMTQSPAASSQNSEIVIGIAAGMKTWDPHEDVSTHVTNIKRQVYETLTTRNNNLELIPLLAKKWETVAEKTWRFYLEENAKFHNGLPLTADDVKFSLERVISPELTLHAKSFLKTIESVQVVDQHTVDIKTSAEDPVLPARLAFCGFIVPKKTVEEMGMEDFRKNPVGTGAFRFVEWVRDNRVVLERNKDYWGPQPQTERIIFKPIPEQSTRIAALETGEIDIAVGIASHLIPQIEKNENLEIASVRSGRNVFIILNKNHQPFDNKLVRQALNYAVDVPAMTKFLFKERAHQVATIGGPAVFGYTEKPDAYPYNVEKAKDLLAKAGYPDGFETEMNIAIGRPFASQDVAQTIVQFLRKVGVTVKINTYDWGEFLADWRKGNAPMYYMGFGTPVLDIDDFIGGYFDPKRRATWGHPPAEALDLAYQAMKAFDPEKRKEIYEKFVAIIQDDAPFIFLFNFDDIYAYNKRIKGFVPRADEQIGILTLSKE